MSHLAVLPAIDVRGGRVVRLRQGAAAAETVYDADPSATARRWEGEGAGRLHVVDLDAALDARPQFDAIAAIIGAVSIPVEVGGGVRTLDAAQRYKEAGADRVIFGTAAVIAPGVVQQAARLWPARIAVALDARDGQVVISGWNETTPLPAVELARRVAAWGVSRIQYTDVTRDGTLSGLNLAGIEAVARSSGLAVTVGGGVGSLDDLRRLAPLKALGVDEVVVGRALYEKRFTLAEAHAAAGRAA